MTIALKYGSPPNIEDCTDIGTVPPGVAPTKFSGEDFGHLPGVHGALGMSIPPHRRAWLTVAHFRKADVPIPYVVRIPGLGKLVYDDHDKKLGFQGDNWEILSD